MNDGLDPENWEEFRATAHKMLDAAVDRLASAGEGRVWTPFPDSKKAEFDAAVPKEGTKATEVEAALEALLPYGVGNTHPRFFGWVHGSGSAASMLAEIAAAAMNANLGGRDHGAIYVERQVIDWARQIMGFPEDSSGLIVTGTSMATFVAMKVARDQRLGLDVRKTGIGAQNLVGYASAQAHSCVQDAFDMLGLGADAMRKVPCNANFELDLDALRRMIRQDRAEGLEPFCVVGTAGTVNVGSIDDLTAIADIAATEELWFHVDGAFGPTAVLSGHIRPLRAGMERADSLAFDFHKWLHVNYSAGCVLIRDGEAHRYSFADRPEYLRGASAGLASGGHWPVDYGPELSRGFMALKIWTQLKQYGTERLGAAITRNCEQAAYLAEKIGQTPELELLAPVALNIVCYRFRAAEGDLDALNEQIVIAMQESGVAVPSTTRLGGELAIRVNLTNHRTRNSDLDLLLAETLRLGAKLSGKDASG